MSSLVAFYIVTIFLINNRLGFYNHQERRLRSWRITNLLVQLATNVTGACITMTINRLGNLFKNRKQKQRKILLSSTDPKPIPFLKSSLPLNPVPKANLLGTPPLKNHFSIVYPSFHTNTLLDKTLLHCIPLHWCSLKPVSHIDEIPNMSPIWFYGPHTSASLWNGI